MDFLDWFYKPLGMDTSDAPLYAKIVVPMIFLFFLGYILFRIYRFYASVRHAFRGPVSDPNSPLSQEQLQRLTIGNLYAYQQGGTLNTVNMKIESTRLNTVLSQYWGIHNREDALGALEYLAQGSYGRFFPAVYAAFMLQDPKAGKEQLRAAASSEDDYEQAVEQLENLHKIYKTLVALKIVKDTDDLKRLGVSGWDAGRLNFIARACQNKGYISEEEMWAYVDKAYAMAHETLTGWQDLANSYMVGRGLWNGSTDMSGLAEDLLQKPSSPWTQLSW